MTDVGQLLERIHQLEYSLEAARLRDHVTTEVFGYLATGPFPEAAMTFMREAINLRDRDDAWWHAREHLTISNWVELMSTGLIDNLYMVRQARRISLKNDRECN